MAETSLQTLLSTKAALDLGLISQADFEAVKSAFLRAQQIKAALDVGLIKQDDYEETKQSFLGSLLGGGGVAAPAAVAAAPAPPAAARPPAPAAAPAPQPRAPAPAAPPPPQQPAAAPRPPVAPPPPTAAPPAVAAQAVAAAAAAAPQLHKVASNPDVPSNIPKMGGIKQLNQGVRAVLLRALCLYIARMQVCAATPAGNSVQRNATPAPACWHIASFACHSLQCMTSFPALSARVTVCAADLHERHCCDRGCSEPFLPHAPQGHGGCCC
jgi:hypothetical protein